VNRFSTKSHKVNDFSASNAGALVKPAVALDAVVLIFVVATTLKPLVFGHIPTSESNRDTKSSLALEAVTTKLFSTIILGTATGGTDNSTCKTP
jgi:hypothetical protein